MNDWRDIDDKGPARLIAKGEGYAMVRRRGAYPFVIGLSVWDHAPQSAFRSKTAK